MISILSLLVAWAAGLDAFPAGFEEIRLGEAANANPFDRQDVFYPGVYVSPWPDYGGEAEACGSLTGAARAIEVHAASGGRALEFPADADSGAAWYFDLPIYSPDARFYVRAAPAASGDAQAALAWKLNGEAAGVTRIPQEGGPFEVVSLRLGRVMPGRCVLECAAREPGASIRLDAFWVTDGPADFLNRLDEEGRAMGPASARMLVYEPGVTMADGVPFRLLDPAEHGGKAIAVSRGEAIRLTVPRRQASQLHLLLGGRLPGQVFEGEAIIRYGTGEEDALTFDIPPVFAEKTPLAALSLGAKRHAYVVSLPVAGPPIQSVTLRSDHEHFAVWAATLETP